MRDRVVTGVVLCSIVLSLFLPPLVAFPRFAAAVTRLDQPPDHVSPDDEVSKLSLTPTFEWKAVAGATEYALYISKPPYGPAHLVFNSREDYEPDQGPITGTSFKLPGGFLEQDVKYAWNMQAGNADGWGPYSSSWFFTTGNLPQLIKDNTMQDGEGRELKFAVTVGGKEYYIVYLASYVDPQTWETHPPRGGYETVFVGTQGRPVHDTEIARRIAVIERARTLIYGKPPEYGYPHYGKGSPFHIGDQILEIDKYMAARGLVKQLEWASDVHAKALVLVMGWAVGGAAGVGGGDGVLLLEFAKFLGEVTLTALPEIEGEVDTWVAEVGLRLTAPEKRILVDLAIAIAIIVEANPDDLDAATFIKYWAELLELGSKDARQMAEEVAVQGLERAKELYREAQEVAAVYWWKHPFSDDALADYYGASDYLEAYLTADQVERLPAWSLLTHLDDYPTGWWGNLWDFLKRVGREFADIVRQLVTANSSFAEMILTALDFLQSMTAEEWQWLGKYYHDRHSAYLHLEKEMHGNTAIVLYTLHLAEGLPAPAMVTLTLDSGPGGRVAWPGEEEFTYEEDTEVTLVAMWDEGYRFTHWSGDVNTITDITADFTTIVMDTNKRVTANFEEVEDGTFPGALETTLWGYYAAWGEALPPLAERGKMFEALGLGLADQYIGAFDQNNALLDALKELQIAPLTFQELLQHLRQSPVTPTRALDIVLSIDRSGSMRGQKMTDAKSAADRLVELLSSQDRVGLVSFASSATLDIGLTSNIGDVKTAIGRCSASGSTNMGDALGKAIKELTNNGGDDSILSIIYFTDGVTNAGPSKSQILNKLVPEALEAGIIIYTLGYGRDVDGGFLRQVAEGTGGKHYFAPDRAKLLEIYTELSQKVKGIGKVAEFRGSVKAGGVEQETFLLQLKTLFMKVFLLWPGSDLDLAVIDPSGRRLIPGPKVVYSGSDALPEYYEIHDPQPGEWTIEIYGREVTGEAEDYTIMVFRPEALMQVRPMNCTLDYPDDRRATITVREIAGMVDLEKVEFTASDLTGSGDNVITAKTLSFSPNRFTLRAGETRDVQMSLRAPRGTPIGDYSGTIEITSGDTSATIGIVVHVTSEDTSLLIGHWWPLIGVIAALAVVVRLLVIFMARREPVPVGLPGGASCPKCGAPGPSGASFCSSCSSKLDLVSARTTERVAPVCSRCGYRNVPGARFCQYCGTALA